MNNSNEKRRREDQETRDPAAGIGWLAYLAVIIGLIVLLSSSQ